MSAKFIFKMLLIFTILKMIQFYSNLWIGIGSWDLNRTVGWGWDISQFIWYSHGFGFFGGPFFFLLGYGYTAAQYKVHPYGLSVIHLVLIFSEFIFGMANYGFNFLFFGLFHVVLWVLFILNLIKAKTIDEQ